MALSLDLRKRIIKAYESNEGSIRSLAERFKVGEATVWRLLFRSKTQGEIKPKAPPGRNSKIDNKGLTIVHKLLSKKNDATLSELCEEFTARTGISVSLMTMHRACLKLKVNYKKNAISH